MKLRRLFIEGLPVFFVALVVSIAVSLLWNLLAHRASTIDWGTSFLFAILFGIIIPWTSTRRDKEK